ncbi:ATP-dependent DNA helicase [Acidiphilium iwatense]|uniref:ATP-dependent DNA helicase n=1 Tax=Acidiphilium iwatense TaxID=768198 RepID=A0ABS9E1A8_9PROT|nr:ATP-dependent DNA helicase [Acidiphilium iwatense]MCF3947711.1 ATP-dependent DNA helicase [Acidiphilium iwatense]
MDSAPRLLLPDAPALVSAPGRAAILSSDGELRVLSVENARSALRNSPPPLVVHGPATLKRLGITMQVLDLLELFAFVMPAQNAAPTPAGLARALDIDPPRGLEDAAAMLPDLAASLLARLAQGRKLAMNRNAAGLAALMGGVAQGSSDPKDHWKRNEGGAGWPWAGAVAAALDDAAARPDRAALRLWSILPEWEDEAPRPPPSAFPVPPDAARTRLAELLGDRAEARQSQSDYASAATAAFAPRATQDAPHCVLAEAGTGTGKTLGYLAPASLWAERNQGAVWISTYTRHLQRQIEQELARLEPDPARLRARVVLRKGRENYLCLLNYEEAVNAGRSPNLIALGLIARWARASNDHDVAGGDLPGWFPELFGAGLLPQIADRRGECIHAACPHWKRCTIEHVIRRARHADLVIANHALVMAQAVWGGLDDSNVPTRYVFDEGHHLFDAADSAFSAELSGIAMAELRRWLLGAEGGRSRARGIAKRLEDLIEADDRLAAPLQAALIAARVLPGAAFFARLAESGDAQLDAVGSGPAETFLAALAAQARARAAERERDSGLGIEVDLYPAEPELAEAASVLDRALARLEAPLKALRARLLDRLDEEAATIEEKDRQRIEAMARGLHRRAIDPVAAWRRMLAAANAAPPAPGERPHSVLFIRLGRDAALLSHLLDPTEAFAETVAAPSHGLLITSATLRDSADRDAESGWRGAEARSGAAHLAAPAIRAAFASPFDYEAQTRIFVVRDAPRDNIDALAAAFRALFIASGGGALGLFTAISRLRAVHTRIAPALAAANIPLYAQHVDAMNNATLVDIFRAEEHACLLGTDAMRDGVDVPGNALRLVVFERTPWPRPDILHRVRRTHLAGGNPKSYDDAIVRLRLRQAFGRLIRRDSDRGVFVLLDRAMPSRLHAAFPAEVTVQSLGLAETIGAIGGFFASYM